MPGHHSRAYRRISRAGTRRLRLLSVTNCPSASVLGWQVSHLSTDRMGEVNGRPDCGRGHARARKAEAAARRSWSARTKLQFRAEDRGFEPRRALPPNRISSAPASVPLRSAYNRERAEPQATGTGKLSNRPDRAGYSPGVRACLVRARCVRPADRHALAGSTFPQPGSARPVLTRPGRATDPSRSRQERNLGHQPYGDCQPASGTLAPRHLRGCSPQQLRPVLRRAPQ